MPSLRVIDDDSWFQSDSGSEEDSVTSSGSESPLSPAGSTDGYDADLEVTDGPAPTQVSQPPVRRRWNGGAGNYCSFSLPLILPEVCGYLKKEI